MGFRSTVNFTVSVLAAVLLAALTFGAASASAGTPLKIEVLSSQANRVTGGDALIGVKAASSDARDKMVVRLNGKVVTGSLKKDPDNSLRKTGVVSGMKDGRNWITAWAPGQNQGSRLAVFNSSLQGPLFSGARQEPFYCTTDKFGLGPAQDQSTCFAPTSVSWFYRASDNTFKPLASPTDRPSDMVQTTTRSGQTVDYVVRLEMGVINRAVYNFATLAAGGQMGNGWNGRFFYNYGGGCSTGHQQGQGASGGLIDDQLKRGFVVLGSSLNVFNTSCNDVLSAETTSMVKEHAIEELGKSDVWTAGLGGSGGSVQIQMIAQNYPGLLDGITPAASFPDNSSPDYPDCRLLLNYFTTTATGQNLTNAQRRAITGMAASDGGCAPLSNGADVVRAQEGCIESVVPPSVIFDPLSNPNGVRCDLWDNMVNVYGTDPSTGYARRTLDNTGVQYGLKALQDGQINMKRFLDLNESIGGYDNNGDLQAARSVGDQNAIQIAYETGRLNSGAGNWTSVPVVDRRAYQDDDPTGNVHQYVNTYRMRARLDKYNGNHDNQVMFRAEGTANERAMDSAAIDTLSNWLDAISNDTSSMSLPEKVVANKPSDAVDACWISGSRIDGVAQIGADNPCENTYAPHSLPANVAGKPLDSITSKCTLKPVNAADYGSPTPDQVARLNTIFPNGVCDWSQPGPGETRLTSGNLNRSFGPAQNSPVVSRNLGLKLDKYKVNSSRKGATVKATATLGSCPAATWQMVTFERKVKQGKKWIWKKAGSKMVSGDKCQASLKVSKVKKQTSLRVTAAAIDGYRAANSPVRTIKIKKPKRHRR